MRSVDTRAHLAHYKKNAINNGFLGVGAHACQAALRASRRVNDLTTAIRVIEGLKNKLQNDKVYSQYLADLKPTIDELGVTDNHGRAL